ncbi:hypothetical protein gp40 [Acidovorax phage Alfacinha1]|nr:hypothetical protein gp40 [Acidovorax phage Alfacinha3]UYL85543.1 hypothetical protein gp40 [Acidovorax phage Alfacinha1]
MKQALEDRIEHAAPAVPTLAPELDLLARPAKPELPKLIPAPAELLPVLMALRDEFVIRSSSSKFRDAASLEWRGLPLRWRMVLVMVAGVGLEDDLSTLASRDWQEMPPPEQQALRSEIRLAKRHLSRITALAARV